MNGACPATISSLAVCGAIAHFCWTKNKEEEGRKREGFQRETFTRLGLYGLQSLIELLNENGLVIKCSHPTPVSHRHEEERPARLQTKNSIIKQSKGFEISLEIKDSNWKPLNSRMIMTPV